MNKKIVAVLVTAGLACFAGLASAATEVIGASNTVTVGNCALLSESVKVGMSAKVIGAYNCSEITNIVSVASCHPGGSRGPLACSSVQNQAEIDAATTAGTTPPDATYPAGCADDGTGTSTVVDFKGFFASSAGGAMSEQSMGGKCETGKVAALKAFGG